MRAECDKYPGRLRDLCEGRGLDGRNTPPQHAVDQFRSSKGLPPILVTQSPDAPQMRISPHRQQSARVSSIGSRLKKMFAEEWGAIPCGECKRAIDKLDRMTVEQVRTNRQEVISDIASRASRAVPQYWAKILTSADQFMHVGGTQYVIGQYVDRACVEEENAR